MPGDGNMSAKGFASADSPSTDVGSMTSAAQDGYDAQQIRALARHPPPGASVYSPTAIVSSALNPRSCVTCRRRKVRCDKHMPCSNCRRAQIPCIFPAPGRAPRRPRPKDPNAPPKQPSSEREQELMKRLRKLEGIVEELSGQIELETVRPPYSTGNSPEGTTVSGGHDQTPGGRQPTAGNFNNFAQGLTSAAASPDPPNPPNPPRTISGNVSEADRTQRNSPDVHKQFGRLMLNEKGGTRYVSSGLWSSITDELDELRNESEEYQHHDSEDSDDEATPDSADHMGHSFTDHHSFILGYRSSDVDLRPLHPLPSQIPFMWQVFQENVDPILKVLHVPTMSKLIRELRNNFDSLTPSTEALMFAIYYASITSLDEDQVKLSLGANKDALLLQYRFALEQALGKANFLTAPDLEVAQAFLLFLVLVRRHDDTRFAWTLTGLLIRICQALGLHRDGTHFSNLTPFQIEMRRRLFWAVCVLDLRSAEDQGTDLTVVEETFDTQFPLNINDADISPDSKVLPEAREGTSDMTFSIIRYEMCTLARRLHTMSSAMAVICPRDSGKFSLEEREQMLVDVLQHVEDKYLKNSTDPMYWAAANIARVIVAKMTLVIYQPVLFPGAGNEYLSQAIRERLFNASLEVFEYTHILNTDPRCKQWRWLFQTYSQWHAVAYTLIEVSHRPWGPKAERAWGALNLRFAAPNSVELERLASHHAVWVPLKKLHDKARKHRESEILRLRDNPQAAQELELEDRCGLAPTSLRAIPGSLKGVVALERWRKLVNAPPIPEALQQQNQQQQEQQEQPQPQSQPQPQPQPQPQQQQTQQQQQQQLQQRQQQQQQLQQGLPLGHELNTTMGNVQQTQTQTQLPQQQLPTSNPMDLLDSVMSNNTFMSSDFAHLFSGEAAEFARNTIFGYQPNEISRMSTPMDFNTSTPNYGLRGANTMPVGNSNAGTFQQQLQQQQQQGMGGGIQSPVSMEDQLPPWLWPGTGSPDIMRMPNLAVEDADMNVDEGFDWQNWQESLGRYELENGGRANSAWGPV
ncbi:fungal-specific transcription factor domain-containing protein [Cladorrhinum sp. PSN259]|nr:fungal-specific transcription factor domain-containing protein [Cladorrhinum sp. PSN259]